MRQEIDGWLELPTFGLAREHQERGQDLQRAWLDYQEASRAYGEQVMRATTDAFRKMEGLLAEHEEPGRQVRNVRALYDLWIDAAEAAYADVAMTPEFSSATGALVNAQMRLRLAMNGEIERVAMQFGLPGRTEVDSLAREVRELKREVRRLRQERSQTTERVDAAREAARPAPAGTVKPAPASTSRSKPRSTAKSASKSTSKTKTKTARQTAASPVIRSTAGKTARRG
jgi:class III poly(R)-hydroxyalkanoic acid synthase PhaE subunit